LSSCDDITRNLNIFSLFNNEKSIEEKLDTASYYMDRREKESYNKAMEIYSEIMAKDPYNSDGIYGYATAYARYNEVSKEVVSGLTQLMGIMADLQSPDAVTLFQRLYDNPEEVQQTQLSAYDISKTVSSKLDGLANDIDNTIYHGRVKSQDVWLDAVVAYVNLCSATITTNDNSSTEAPAVLLLTWDPVTKKISIDVQSYVQWQLIEAQQRLDALNAAKVSLQKGIGLIIKHTGASELQKLSDGLDEITAKFDEFIQSLEDLITP
jgi:hypothetical protein